MKCNHIRRVNPLHGGRGQKKKDQPRRHEEHEEEFVH
jgi:hypothetical protein